MSRTSWLAVAALLGLTLLMFGDVLLTRGDTVLSAPAGDLGSQFIYWRQFSADQLRHGHLPLWNPQVFCGMPFLGWSQAGVFYPLNWLDLVLPLSKSINLEIALQIFLAGCGTYWWARRRGLGAVGGVVAGALFMFGGAHFLHVYAGHLSLLGAITWLPWLLVALDGWIETRTPGWLMLGIGAVALQILAGDPQGGFYTAMVAALYTGLQLPGRPRPGRILAGLLVIYAGAAALGAVQLLTSLDAASESVRAHGLTYQAAARFSFPLENLITLFAPGFFGSPGGVTYWGRWEWWEMSVFVGATGMAMAGYGLVGAGQNLRRVAVGMIAILLVLALGAHTPLFSLLHRWVWGFDKFRATARFMIPSSLFVALLAGFGCDRWLARPTGEFRFALGLILAAALLAGIGGWLRWQTVITRWDSAWARVVRAEAGTEETFLPPDSDEEPSPEFIQRAGRGAAASLFIAAGLLAVAAGAVAGSHRVPPLARLVPVLVVVEVFGFARFWRPTFDLAQTKAPVVESVLREHPGEYRVLSFQPNVAMTMSQGDIWGYAPMGLERYASFFAFSQGQSPDTPHQEVQYRRFSPLFSLLRCRYVFVPDQGTMRVFSHDHDLPRLLLLEGYQVRSNRDEILTALASPQFDPRRCVILETEPDPKPVAATTRGMVRLIESSADSLTVAADLPAPAILLITDAYSRGWQARPLPGSAQQHYQVLPADYVLRAVPLTQGHHLLRLEYRPRAYVVGKWISLGALAAGAAMLAGLAVRHRGATRHPPSQSTTR